MLAIVSPNADLETVQILLQNRANINVQERDTNNNLFHLAALHCTNNEIFRYLVKNVGLDIFARNKAGETCASLVKLLDDKERFQLVEEIQTLRDRTKLEADQFLQELESAKRREEEQKAKKKEKKHKNKL
jgi:ankyrin repeat protein